MLAVFPRFLLRFHRVCLLFTLINAGLWQGIGLFGQSLVQNPSFEQATAIPLGTSQVNTVSGWNNGAPSIASPDYFHLLSPSIGLVALPLNLWGYTFPFDGLAAVGFYCYAPAGYREYVRTQLMTPMLPGQQYQVRFAITLGELDSSGLGLGGSDGFGLLFSSYPASQGSISPSYTQHIPATPQWELPTIFTSEDWEVFSFLFWPDSVFQYITFGNFRPNNATLVHGPPNSACYLFLDRVDVVPVLAMAGPNTACEGDSLLFRALPEGGQYQWTLNGTPVATGDSLWVLADSSFSVELIAPGASQSKIISVRPRPVFSLGPDRILCSGDSITLGISPLPGWDLRWSGGSQDSTWIATQPGWVFLEVDAEGCFRRDSLWIEGVPVPLVNLGPDSSLCPGDSLFLSASPEGTRMWWDGDTAPGRMVWQPGLYWLEVENICGVFRDTVEVSIVPEPVAILPADTSLCPGAVWVLQVEIKHADWWIWENGSREEQRSVEGGGPVVWLEAGNRCGITRDSLTISLLQQPAIDLGPDLSICPGQQLVLRAATNLDKVTWDDSSTAPERTISAGGFYWAAAENECARQSDTIRVESLSGPRLPLLSDTVLCQGSELVLDLGQAGVEISWSDGWPLPGRVIDEPGEWAVKAENGCGELARRFVVEMDTLLSVTGWPDTVLCEGEEWRLIRPGYVRTWAWSDGSDREEWLVDKPGQVTWTATNACGSQSGALEADFRPCDCNWYVPNAFSPNGDGVNDLFSLGSHCQWLAFEFSVWDRWGRKVAVFDRPDFRWGGSDLPEGVYVWQMSWTWLGRDVQNSQRQSGSLTLLR